MKTTGRSVNSMMLLFFTAFTVCFAAASGFAAEDTDIYQPWFREPAEHELLLLEADKLYEQGEHEAALQVYEQHIAKAGFPRTTDRALYRIAVLGLRARQTGLFFEYASRLSMWFPESPYNHGIRDIRWQAYAMEGNYLNAARSLAQSLEYSALDETRQARLRVYLAGLYQRAYRPEEAVEEFLTVLRLRAEKEDAARALFNLAQWFKRRGDRELALVYISRLLREYPGTALQSRAELLQRRVAWTYMNEETGLPSNAISSIAFDGDDIWIGTWLSGVIRYTRSSGREAVFNTANSRLSSNLIRDIAVTPHRVWIATFEGLVYYDKVLSRWNTVQTVAGLAQQRIKSLLVDDGRLWVSTIGRGVSMLDFRTGQWITYTTANGLPGNNVVALCATPGSIWIGTIRGGIARYDKRTRRWRTFRQRDVAELQSDNIRAIAFDGVRLWIGTHGGGVSSCYEDGTGWRHYGAAGSRLSSDFVYTIAAAPAGTLWMGTLGGGVSIYNPKDQTWAFFRQRDGLPGDEITAIAFEGAHIWFGTLNGGIGIFTTEEETYGR